MFPRNGERAKRRARVSHAWLTLAMPHLKA
jgi:hypothetical protein